MSSVTTNTELLLGKTNTAFNFQVALNRVAGTYPICWSGQVDNWGPVLVKSVVIYCDDTVTGLTSITVQTSDVTPVVILGSTLAAALTAGKNLTPFTTPFYLDAAMSIDVTITGDGTAGSIRLGVECISLADKYPAPYAA